MNKKILAVDTSSHVLALALSEGRDKLWEINETQQFRHIELIMPLIESGLKECKWTLRDVDIIVCGLGPGSFTGLRVGIAVVKALALAGGQKIVTVSSLDVIAHGCNKDCELGVLIDARREKIYYAQFVIKKGVVCQKGKDSLISCHQLISRINKRSSKILLAGDGIRSYGKSIKSECPKKVIFAREDLWYPHGSSIVESAQSKIKKNEYTPIPALLPQYMRLTPAEEARQKKKR